MPLNGSLPGGNPPPEENLIPIPPRHPHMLVESVKNSEPVQAVMYIFLNKGLGMSTGKAAAQAAHAAVEAYRLTWSDSRKRDIIDAWYLGGHHTKIVLEARDSMNLMVIGNYITERGFECKLIIDEGRTEIDAHTPTALGVEIVDKNDPHVVATFGDFKLYKDDPPKSGIFPKWKL